MDCYISNFHIIRPAKNVTQQEMVDWLASLLVKEEARKKILELGIGPQKIAQRGIHIPNYFDLEWRSLGFQERSTIYETVVNQLFEEFYPETTAAPEHLIHVSCTGYVAPSGAQNVVSKRGWVEKTSVTHAYHMGCYGALPALRIAQGFLHKDDHVDIVHTELCTLHVNPDYDRVDQLVVKTLFADGFIKYSLNSAGGLFKVLGVSEEIIPESTGSMTWKNEESCMGMFIGKEVPVLIARFLQGYLERLCKKAGLDEARIRKSAFFAVHPGGPKIIDHVEKILELAPEQVSHSKEILRFSGNMSSATLPHVWEKMAKDPKILEKDLIVSVAFGPGLTVSGCIFERGCVCG